MHVAEVVGSAWAHYAEDGRAHLLVDHLRDVASRAKAIGDKFGSSFAGELAGLWHDLGKYSGDFQAMIRRENGVEAHIEVEGGPRDHSTAGALHAMARVKDPLVAVALAFVIAGHHAGLADRHALQSRLSAKARLLEAVFARSPDAEVVEAPAVGARPKHLEPQPQPLDSELWIRLLFSALCDADFLDTESFYRPSQGAQRERPHDLAALRDALHDRLDRMARSDTEVNRARAAVREACSAAATRPTGVFSLTVPTGGGKTLASMCFALDHAVAHGLDRVIVAIPFTSILEQNAKVYRDLFGDDAVVEHHSSLDPEKEDHRNRLASENWDAPIVVTTTVQLFESLLSSRPRACRKLHNLTRSVIVLDEAQSLPAVLLPVILDILARLCRSYRTSVVISTATQPALGRSEKIEEGFEHITEICPPSLNLFERLRRVQVCWPRSPEQTPYEVIANEAAGLPRVLVIVHRRRDATDLCRSIDERRGDRTTVHLSALMTPRHRQRVLEAVRGALQRDVAVRLVATQLVEAGVDVDFPIVYRAFAGLDSLAQAAGRCNREGRLPAPGELRVFFAQTEPPPGVLTQAFHVARTMWTADRAIDLFAPSTHARFFAQLYENMDLTKGRDLQRKRGELQFAMVDRGDETIGGFQMITNDWAAPLVVAHDERATRLIAELERDGPSRLLARRLQQYVVNVPRRALSGWTRAGHVRIVAETVAVLDGAGVHTAYDDRFGLLMDRVGSVDPAFLIL